MYQPQHYISCQLCNKQFTYKADFDNHQLSHDVQQIQHNTAVHAPTPDSQFMPNPVHAKYSATPVAATTTNALTFDELDPIDVKPTLTTSGKVAAKKSESQKLPKVGGRLKAYPCDECEKSYTRRDHLQRHKITHTGCRPYACSICAKAFYRKDKLQRHERTHFKDTYFNCKQCGKQCKRKETLSQHEKTHEPKSL